MGSKQRTYADYDKSAGSSPTVTTKRLILTTAIDAHEDRYVVTSDVGVAFLHADNDEDVLMKLRGKLVEMLVQLEPSMHRKYVTTGPDGEPILYVRLLKALYGLLRSALLFYKKLRGDLENMGFAINPYDPCVASKTVKGSQMTVTWHVDNFKISHKKSAVVGKFVSDLNKLYDNKLTTNRGKVHSYLGMDFDFSTKGTVRVGMIPYSKQTIAEFPAPITSTAPTPAADHLFTVRPDNERKVLPEEQAQAFHRTTAQLLFLSQRARPDLATLVSFLTKRVQSPDEDDWGKLMRGLRYLKDTRHMKLNITIDSLTSIRYASYGVHHDCKAHTGMMMTLGDGAAMSMSRAQKMNT